MDVAPWIPDDFWREWRSVVKQTRPDAVTVAETWFDASKFFLGDEFDSTMNYIFRDAVLAYANGGDAQLMVANLEEMREAYPPADVLRADEPAVHARHRALAGHLRRRRRQGHARAGRAGEAEAAAGRVSSR